MNMHAIQNDDRDVPALPGTDGVLASGSRRAGDAMRFTYPTGSRPLEGYTIKRGIGRGGFGEVYYAVSDGGKEVALKLIRRNFEVELRGVAHCMNLKHPNLLGLYDVRSDQQDDRWVVMEYVTGVSLEDLIADYPEGVPADEANAWMHGIAAGVAYLHESGIVHRDLKPGNIFSDQGLVKIGDYGLSKFISCSRRSGQTESVGTVHYMAPEIANGRYGKEIDIYALGVILFEMLTGSVPFEGESVGEVLMKHLTAEPDVSSVPQPYQAIVERALAKDPEVRYASAAEMLADLPDPVADSNRTHTQPRVACSPSERSAEDIVVAEIADGPVVATLVQDATVEQATVEQAAVGTSTRPASSMPEEPIWKWIRTACGNFGHAWNNNLNIATKVILLIVGIWMFLFAFSAIIPTLVILVSIYLGYWAIWTLVVWSSRPKSTHPPAAQNARPPSDPTTASASAKPRSGRRRRWLDTTTVAIPRKASRQRVMELAGSMVLSGIVCLVISIVMLLLRGETFGREQFVWLSLVSICGSWGILIPAKIWEGRDGEPALRRFCLLAVGLLVGAVAYYAHELLLVALPHEFTPPVFASVAEQGFASPAYAARDVSGYQNITVPSANEQLSLMTCLSYFGFLFLLIRWWRLADPLRSARLSLWTTAVCVTWAGALYLFWPFPASWDVFPQPWGFMVAAAVAVATQLSSPWINAKRKKVVLTD